MFVHQPDTADKKLVIGHWFLLALNGGMINAGGFLATGRFVSHVTGFATLFGVHLAHDKPDIAIGALTVPLFFLFGSFLAGFLIDRPIYRGEVPHFDWVMGMSAICLFLSALGGEAAQFSLFRMTAHTVSVYFLMALLCLACGLQNGAITSSSGSTVRTTHLTGLTTDLGLGIARLVTYKSEDKKRKKEVRANWLRIGTILSFLIGSTIGAYLFLKFGHRSFMIPGVIASYATWHGYKAKIIPHKQKILGT